MINKDLNALDGEDRVHLSVHERLSDVLRGEGSTVCYHGGFLAGVFCLRNGKKVLALCNRGRWPRAKKYMDLGNCILSE